MCQRGATDAPDAALILAQQLNGHGIFCGTEAVPCVACEALTARLARKGLEVLKAEAECELVWRSEEAELVAAEQASLYFQAIKPGRVQLWDVPVWLAQVAEVGDLVQAKAEAEVWEKSQKGLKHSAR